MEGKTNQEEYVTVIALRHLTAHEENVCPGIFHSWLALL